MPVLNRLVMVRMTTSPIEDAISSSSNEKPRCDFELRMFKVLACFLVIARDQTICRKLPRRSPAGFRVADSDRDRHHVLVRLSTRQQYWIDGDGSGEIAQAHDLIVGGAQNAVASGQH